MSAAENGQLRSSSWHERLKAVRILASTAQPNDLHALQAMLAIETVAYVRRALESIIARLNREIEDDRASQAQAVPPSIMRQVHAKAVEEVSRTILHEIETIVGAVSLSAAREIPDFENSATNTQLTRLVKQLEAITQLKLAASSPRFEQFDLGSWIKEIVAQETAGCDIQISLVGAEHVVVYGDTKLLRLALCNGLRNAIEATQITKSLGAADVGVIVSWQATDVECWIAIKDDGPGLAGTSASFSTSNASSKPGHAGMGLMIAKQAIDSLDGIISLSDAAQGGAIFQMEWFGK